MNTTPPPSIVSNASVALRRATAIAWGVIGAVIGGVVGFVAASVVGLVVGLLVVGVILGFLGAFLAGRFVDSSVDVVMSLVPSRVIDASVAPRLFNLLQGLCASAGVGAPRVSITEDDGINALVAADPSRHRASELIVTRGFVDHLERIEMEGVVAVCLARLRSGLVEAQTLAAAVVIGSPWFVPGTARRAFVSTSSAGQTVFDADVKGVGITRYPPGLAAAYQQMLAKSTRVTSADPRTALLWLANPLGESEVSANDVAAEPMGSRVDGSSEERPPLSERLALLREI
jgi:heat shock protein HtpX